MTAQYLQKSPLILRVDFSDTQLKNETLKAIDIQVQKNNKAMKVAKIKALSQESKVLAKVPEKHIYMELKRTFR